MATNYGTPPIVTDGVVFNVDAANIKTIVTGSTTFTDMAGNYMVLFLVMLV